MPSRTDPGAKHVRGGLSRARILEAALSIVDREGLAALSMRRLGAELGVEAMSLYNHVPSKAAVLDGLQEVILEGLPLLGSPCGDWVEVLRSAARSFRGALAAHPNALPLFASRPAVTPAVLRHVDAALGVLRGAGFGPGACVSAFQTLVAFVVGNALSSFGPTAAGDVSPPRYGDLPPEEFPHLTAIVPSLGDRSALDDFEFGLDVLLVGLRARAASCGRALQAGEGL
ncbi:TetR family transcriptional regulator [Sorangium cellulosum]|uniref:TetR family transcriptional regulator n=1 Tax=Sorangium cellulosum TaxID=56 RepID=A0A2L0ELC6_SORCE|nr:TetR/AcrR family transcriptional regulator C-terminal domain-containing protein [Sorangium cellulosum]AUX40101.1 TetR family transcriptional regulator [Sorangium cellulosum]